VLIPGSNSLLAAGLNDESRVDRVEKSTNQAPWGCQCRRAELLRHFLFAIAHVLTMPVGFENQSSKLSSRRRVRGAPVSEPRSVIGHQSQVASPSFGSSR
jgi:hypothetical protein